MKLFEDAFIFIVVLFVVILPVIMFTIIAVMGWRIFGKRSNKKYLANKTIVPQYEPPTGITPAETGLLFDQKGGRLEFLATIYDLKTKKVISMDRSDSGQVSMKLLAYQPATLTSYEDLLVRYFFHDNKEQVLDSFFGQKDFSTVQSYFQYLVTQTLQAKGLLFLEEGYELQPYATFLDKVASDPLGAVFNYLKHGLSNNLTAKTIEMMPMLEGFKQYIETAELDKINFQVQGNSEQYIEHLTPYAIVFNQIERWQIVGIPLFSFKREELKAAQHQPMYSKENVYIGMAKIVNNLDAYKVL